MRSASALDVSPSSGGCSSLPSTRRHSLTSASTRSMMACACAVGSVSTSSCSAARPRRRANQAHHLGQQRVVAVGALLEDPFHGAVEPPVVLDREVSGRDYYYGNRAARLVAS